MNQTMVIDQQNLIDGSFAPVTDKVHLESGSKVDLIHSLAAVNAEIGRIADIIAYNDFYPFEQGKDQFQALLPQLCYKAERLKMAIAGYTSWMDPSFLSLTQPETQLPLFMVLDVNSDQGFGISVDTRVNLSKQKGIFTPRLPKIIKDQFVGVVETLSKFPWRNTVVSIHANYAGLMPEKIRAMTRKAEASGLFHRNIFVVAEAPRWQINVVVYARTDPLVIGVSNFGQIYLLGQYEPTMAESYISANYVQSEGGL